MTFFLNIEKQAVKMGQRLVLEALRVISLVFRKKGALDCSNILWFSHCLWIQITAARMVIAENVESRESSGKSHRQHSSEGAFFLLRDFLQYSGLDRRLLRIATSQRAFSEDEILGESFG
jgi:hypothetical protein